MGPVNVSGSGSRRSGSRRSGSRQGIILSIRLWMKRAGRPLQSAAGKLSRPLSFFLSVRFRLALWFALVLALVMLAFSLFVYYRQVKDIRDLAAARLVVRLRDLNVAFLRSYSGSLGSDWLRFPGLANSSPFVLQENEVLILSDPQGSVGGSWGNMSQDEAALLSSEAVALAQTKKASPLFTADLHSVVEPPETGPVNYMFSASPIIFQDQSLGWIILGRPVDPNDQLPRLALTLALAGAGTLLVAMAGGYWLANRALWPVKAITRTAQEIGETDLSRRLNLHSRDELGELAATIDHMLDRLQSAFIRQRQFTADASHELRTPLAIIELETSRALTAPRSAEEYRRALEVIQSENSFMTRLVTELLTLARMDSGQAQLKLEPLDLSDLALEGMERYAPLASQKGIILQTGELPELPILGDRTFLLQMVGNLVDNAIKYQPAEGERWVRIETGRSAARLAGWLRVSDNGPGIPAADLPKLFDRFYRVDNARSHNLEAANAEENEIPGSGLGLSIVQRVAQLHGGEVIVRSEEGRGATFEVHIPLQE